LNCNGLAFLAGGWLPEAPILDRLTVSGLEQLDTYALPAKVPQWQMGWSGGTPPSGRRRRGSNLSPSNFEGGVAGWDLEGPALGGYPGEYQGCKVGLCTLNWLLL
jgi:hypothetical protein